MADRKSCSIEDCDKPLLARTWCSKHWTRWQRYGDPTFRLPGEVRDGKLVCSRCKEDKPVESFTPKKDKPNGCDSRCRSCCAAITRSRRPPGSAVRQKTLVQCAYCWAAFMGDDRKTRYCSKACQRQGKLDEDREYAQTSRGRESHREANRRYRESNPEKNWKKAATYRARKTAAYVEDVDREAILARDGWCCQICRDPIPRGTVYPDPLSPSIDHRVPLARGGYHSLTNCQAAHLGCNSAKGARLQVVI